MTEPTRLRDAGPEDLRALLRAAAPSRAMTPDERARTRGRLARHVTAAAVAGGVSWLSGAALGAGLGVVVGVTSFFFGGWPASDVPDAAPTAPARRAPVSSPAQQAPPPAVMASAPAESSSPPMRATPPLAPASAATTAVESSEDVLAEEVTLLDRARAALDSRPSEALALAADHATRYPRGKLGIERELVAIDALRRLGRTGEARSRAAALLARARGSLYEDRIRRMLGADP